MRIADLIAAVELDGAASVVMVAEAKGSVPREAGAWMIVTPDVARGTIGGGTVEHRAIARAREMLAGSHAEPVIEDYPLGPAMDQCCGGHMRVAFAVFGAGDLADLRGAGGEVALWQGGPVLREDAAPRRVLIYGAGHVGTALVRALAPLPFAVRWVDARLDAFPAEVPDGVETVATPLPEAEARAALGDALHVVLTHSHALDMEIVGAVLERGEFGYLGLIGSDTKKALFQKKLRARGIPQARLARLVCPIGVPGVTDKRPEVIAASVAAQLLQACAARVVQKPRETA
jgi:xanthine dehydrogenase accessory factor